MIRVTRLNGQPIALNSDLIKFVERSPDTVITLTNGEKLIVRETEEEVLHLILEFRRSLIMGTSAHGSDQQARAALLQKPLSMGSEGQRRG